MSKLPWIVAVVAIVACIAWTAYYRKHAENQVRKTAQEMSTFCKGELRKQYAANRRHCIAVLKRCGCLE